MTVSVLCLFLMVLRIGLRYVIMVAPGHIHFFNKRLLLLLGFSLPVKAAPHECEIRTSQP